MRARACVCVVVVGSEVNLHHHSSDAAHVGFIETGSSLGLELADEASQAGPKYPPV